MSNNNINNAKRDFENRASHMNEEDVRETLKNGQKAKDMAKSAGVLRKYAEDICTFLSMTKDYVTGAYREVPFGTIAAIAGAIAYLVSPIDAIPDPLPIIGLLDDAAVLGLCLKMVQCDVEDYRAWKNTRALAA